MGTWEIAERVLNLISGQTIENDVLSSLVAVFGQVARTIPMV